VTTHVVSPIEFDGREIEVTGGAYQHLFRAKRLRVGEELRVVDGEGRARRGVVARVERAHGVVALGSAEPSRESELLLELWVAPPKPDRAAWLVEKATEIGARAVRFVASARAARDERSFGAAQLMRLHRVAIAAVEQCGRSVVPEVSGLHSVDDTLARAARLGAAVVALDASGPRAAPAASALGPGIALAVLVGPEGGWTPEELVGFAERGVALWSLGPRVLRVETAALVAAALALAPHIPLTPPGAGSSIDAS
jgi:16S rRNA (uracil1498-N3)-methyltransferase